MAPEATLASLSKPAPLKSGSNGYTPGMSTPPHTPARPILEGILYRESAVIPGVAKKRYFVLYS